MPNLVVIAQIPFATVEARDTMIEKISQIAQYAKENEEGTLKYFACVPRGEEEGNELFVVEEYTSRAAFDIHMASPPVKDILAWMSGNPQFFAGEATVSMTESHASFTRPSILSHSDPWICYASIEYKPGQRAVALDPWKHVASETERNEPETLSYSILKDEAHPEKIKTVEVYASEGYFKEVHVPSEAVQENVRKYGSEIRVSIRHAFLKLRGGFLGR